MKDLCDCGEQRDYQDCCGALHRGESQADTAEQLMRSRYTAFARGHVDYLVMTQTLLPAKASREELEQDLAATKWLRLDVIKSQNISSNSATVEFCAYAVDLAGRQKKLIKHHEYSEFCQTDGRWLYEQGEIMADSGPVKWKRNQPCLCGSGRKAKHCCGA
ncbi:YchJ family protein [Lacimicrobium alkaliphilum]|uniref:UPF0225 protein n=1 Tax=Lacimicrobium alkaliphilum TaxID=1526571 RepID=A0ABQ1R2B7_9ALTE|nr:YchJ family metal-binding protein [Lacimicrobium alkaliphilum]GGD53204.1 UPF0225 protein [Lacimicrobium alkaliphilum]